MIKVLLASAALVVGTAGFASADPDMATAPHVYKTKKVRANGRCNGMSYGTGARRCGSLSGGPAGGNSSRN